MQIVWRLKFCIFLMIIGALQFIIRFCIHSLHPNKNTISEMILFSICWWGKRVSEKCWLVQESPVEIGQWDSIVCFLFTTFPNPTVTFCRKLPTPSYSVLLAFKKYLFLFVWFCFLFTATLNDYFEIRWGKNLMYKKERCFMLKENNANSTNIVNQWNL